MKNSAKEVNRDQDLERLRKIPRGRWFNGIGKMRGSCPGERNLLPIAYGFRKSCCSRRALRRESLISSDLWSSCRISHPWQRRKMKRCETLGGFGILQPGAEHEKGCADHCGEIWREPCRRIIAVILSLPGVGEYTAGAVAPAFGVPVPAVVGKSCGSSRRILPQMRYFAG